MDVWLIDSGVPSANPTLSFVLRVTASVTAELRDESRTVLLHCARAQQRAPSVAVACAPLSGAARERAAAAVQNALSRTRGHGLLWDAATF